MVSSASQVFLRALKYSAILVSVVLLVGSSAGLLLAGAEGFITAVVGSLIAFAFSALTLLSVWLGGKLPLGGFYGLVLGGWLAKILLFAIGLGALQRAEFVHGPTLFFAIVASVLGSLGIDSWVVLRSRIPTVSDPS